MDPVQALAILSLGAFVTVLVTALFYILTVRPRLLEPVSLSALGVLDDRLYSELDAQRSAVSKLNASLAHHTSQLEASASRLKVGEDFDALRGMLAAQQDTVQSLTGLLNGLDERLTRQETVLQTTAERVADLSGAALPTLQTQIADQNERLGQLATTFDARLGTMIQDQAQKLVEISARLDTWAADAATRDDKLAAHARVLAELDRELAAQAEIAQRLDAKTSEHTTMLVTAAAERREQAGLLERLMYEIKQVGPAIKQILEQPRHEPDDRLTDIRGIGPVYASRLYEAGITTFQQLAAVSPEEIFALLSLPDWRRKSVNPASWIEQARHFASQREKVEKLA